MAETVLSESGEFVRHYPFGEIFAHAIGYVYKGNAGIELYENFTLQTLHNEFWQRSQNTFCKPICREQTLF